MCRLKRKQKAFAWLLLSLVAFFLLVICAAFVRAETTYSMKETELIRLRQICGRLETLNNRLLTELNVSRKSLTELQNELNSYKTELTDLSAQLEQSKAESVQILTELSKARSLLVNAETSFGIFKAEAEKRINSLIWQRNIAVIIAIAALIF